MAVQPSVGLRVAGGDGVHQLAALFRGDGEHDADGLAADRAVAVRQRQLDGGKDGGGRPGLLEPQRAAAGEGVAATL